VTLDVQLYNRMIVEPSVIWVLRLCLLFHTGFIDEEIRTALADHDRYELYRENLKKHVKERFIPVLAGKNVLVVGSGARVPACGSSSAGGPVASCQDAGKG